MKDRLVENLARLGAHRKAIQEGRRQLLEHARGQLDTVTDAISAIEHGVDAGQGDILGQRRLRTLLQERERLQAVVRRMEKMEQPADSS